MKEPLVSIIMRNFNEGWALPETLAAIQGQDYKNWELIVIDSGSTDGSVELIREFGPAHLVEIPSGSYIPGKVLNMGMRLAKSDYCLFLNADAVPQDAQWLRKLVEPLQNGRASVCFGRQKARPDCRAVFANDYERCFGPQRESAEWEHFFSMVSSGLRRDVWEERPFREDLQYAEDDEYTRWCGKSGHKVEYVIDSVVMHSHNYTPEESYKRAYGDAFAQGQASDRIDGMNNWWKHVPLGWLRDVVKDTRFCMESHRLNELGMALKVRWYQRTGRFDGFRAAISEMS